MMSRSPDQTHTPSLAETPALLPYDALASVVSTAPISTDSPPSSPHSVLRCAMSTLPSFAGTPARARRPACLVPLTTGHTPTCLAFSGVSVTSHTPYWECDRGYRHTQVMTTGIRVSSDSIHCCWQDSCQTLEAKNYAVFLAFLK